MQDRYVKQYVNRNGKMHAKRMFKVPSKDELKAISGPISLQVWRQTAIDKGRYLIHHEEKKSSQGL